MLHTLPRDRRTRTLYPTYTPPRHKHTQDRTRRPLGDSDRRLSTARTGTTSARPWGCRTRQCGSIPAVSTCTYSGLALAKMSREQGARSRLSITLTHRHGINGRVRRNRNGLYGGIGVRCRSRRRVVRHRRVRRCGRHHLLCLELRLGLDLSLLRLGLRVVRVLPVPAPVLPLPVALALRVRVAAVVKVSPVVVPVSVSVVAVVVAVAVGLAVRVAVVPVSVGIRPPARRVPPVVVLRQPRLGCYSRDQRGAWPSRQPPRMPPRAARWWAACARTASRLQSELGRLVCVAYPRPRPWRPAGPGSRPARTGGTLYGGRVPRGCV